MEMNIAFVGILTLSVILSFPQCSSDRVNFGPHGDEHCVCGNFDAICHFPISSACNSDSVNLDHMELCFVFVSPTAAEHRQQF